MSAVTTILLQSTEILTILVAVVGLILSGAILISPAAVRKLSFRLNRQFNLDAPLSQLNRQVPIEMILDWFPFVSGSIIAGVSLAVIIYLFFTSMPTYSGRVLLAIGFESLLWLARLASVLAFVFGLLLMFAPEVLKRINEKLNRWHDADAVVRHMEQTVYDFDGWILNNPRASGVIGFLLSVILLTITISPF
ncbi:MAG: hypothetical protein ABIL58_17435 [Pseudomonadota bacterium]